MPVRLTRLLLVITLIVTIPVPARLAAGPGEVRFSGPDSSIVLVPAHVNGRGPFPLVIDTGSTATMLNEELARQIGLHPHGIVPIMTVAGAWDLSAGILDELVVSNQRFEQILINWGPLRRLHFSREEAAGIIGQDILRVTTTTIDYRMKRVSIQRDGSCAPGDVEVPALWLHDRPIIEVRLHGIKGRSSSRLVLDSGADAMLLFTDALEGDVANARATSQNGSVAARLLPLARVSIGHVRASGPSAEVVTGPREEDGLLPTSWFSRVCLDGPRSVAVLDAR
jgi:hypothetical protein